MQSAYIVASVNSKNQSYIYVESEKDSGVEILAFELNFTASELKPTYKKGYLNCLPGISL